MESEKIEEKQGKNDEVLIYEISYLLLPNIAATETSSKAQDLKSEMQSLGAQIISDENPVLIDLAYAMVKTVGATRHKVTTGYFGWVKLEVKRDSEAVISKIKRFLDENNDIVRYLIVKTVRENTLLNGKMMLQKEKKEVGEVRDSEDSVEPESEKPVGDSAEEIDKSIDNLVIA